MQELADRKTESVIISGTASQNAEFSHPTIGDEIGQLRFDSFHAEKNRSYLQIS